MPAGQVKVWSREARGSNGCDITTDEAVCAAQAYEGEAIPLDIYIMFDQSGSMLNDVGGLTTPCPACPDR